MIALVLARTREVVRARTHHAAYEHRVHGLAPAARPLKDLSAFPVCGSVRPLASQRALRYEPGADLTGPANHELRLGDGVPRR